VRGEWREEGTGRRAYVWRARTCITKPSKEGKKTMHACMKVLCVLMAGVGEAK
jgi:hypothetical protein